MYRSFYAGLESVMPALFSLAFFLAAFAWVLVRVARRKGNAAWEQAARLPLADDLPLTSQGTGHE